LLLTLGLAVGAVRLRDGQRRHAVALVNAAGIVTLALALSYLIALTVTVVGPLGSHRSGAPFGWKLFILAMGFGLIAYAGADREPGPAYIGVVLLLAFAVLVGSPSINSTSLLGWPLFLLALGVVGLVIGLRSSTPAPPPPPTTVAPTIPLGRDGS
jgi:peptidoglycan/LPS O-acetylase OafA/YrhL